MVSSTSFFCAVAALAVAVQHVNAHGYMYIPLAEFTGSASSAWIVQIDPQWTGDWDTCSSDDSDCLTSVYTTLKESNGYSDIRTLLDSDTTLYGADCGFTNADATAKDPPTTGDATFSRGMVHVGPCEIWLDDTMVLSNDDCMTAYGDGTQETASVFTPVDYSSCSTSGCMLRFYWLAFQGVDSEIVWQVYKDCVPLTGPADGETSTSTTTTSSSTTSETTSSTTGDEADDTTTTSASAATGASTTEASATTGTSTTESSATTGTESSATTGTSTTESSATTGTESSATTGTESSAATGTSTTESSAATGTSYTDSSATTGTSYTDSSATTGGSSTTTSSATTGGDSWTSTGSAATSSGESMTSGSTTQGNGNQGGNGWSGGFGGMGGGMRK